MYMSAYDEIYDLYAERLYYYCFKLTKDTYMAEDLTQTTFLKAIEKLHTFKNQSSVFTWLCTIAKNEFINELNKNKRLSYEKILDIYHEDDVANVEDIVISKHIIRKLARIIKKLDDDFINYLAENGRPKWSKYIQERKKITEQTKETITWR